MANNGPDVNGVKHNFSSVTVDANGKLKGVKSISYKNDIAGPKTYELGSAEASGRGRGKLNCEASMVMYRKDYDAYRDSLGDGFMEVPVNITVSYADIGQPTVNDRLIGCKMVTDDHNADSGSDDALEVTVDLQPMRVFPGGKKPIRNMKE